jgi:hypothetical protein
LCNQWNPLRVFSNAKPRPRQIEAHARGAGRAFRIA